MGRTDTNTRGKIVGAIDPVQMTQQAPNQEILYVSGWACSAVLTTTNEVSPDFGDYPYNTVPNQVQRLFKAQSMHDRKQWDARRKLTAEKRKDTPYVDYLRPIVADGDTGWVPNLFTGSFWLIDLPDMVVCPLSLSSPSCSPRMVLRLSTSRTSCTAERSAAIWPGRFLYLWANTLTD